jgi:hypothetical protein
MYCMPVSATLKAFRFYADCLIHKVLLFRYGATGGVEADDEGPVLGYAEIGCKAGRQITRKSRGADTWLDSPARREASRRPDTDRELQASGKARQTCGWRRIIP